MAFTTSPRYRFVRFRAWTRTACVAAPPAHRRAARSLPPTSRDIARAKHSPRSRANVNTSAPAAHQSTNDGSWSRSCSLAVSLGPRIFAPTLGLSNSWAQAKCVSPRAVKVVSLITRRRLCNTARDTEGLFALSCRSKAEVDEMVKTAIAAGGTRAMDGQTGSRFHVRLELLRPRRPSLGSHLDGLDHGPADKLNAIGPRSALDVSYHVAIVGVLVWGLMVAWRARVTA